MTTTTSSTTFVDTTIQKWEAQSCIIRGDLQTLKEEYVLDAVNILTWIRLCLEYNQKEIYAWVFEEGVKKRFYNATNDLNFDLTWTILRDKPKMFEYLFETFWLQCPNVVIRVQQILYYQKEAAKKGTLSVLKFIYSKGFRKLHIDVIDIAAENNHLEVVMWILSETEFLAENPNFTLKMDILIYYEKYEILDWFFSYMNFSQVQMNEIVRNSRDVVVKAKKSGTFFEEKYIRMLSFLEKWSQKKK